MRNRRRHLVVALVAVLAVAAGPLSSSLFDSHRAHLHKVDAPHSQLARLAAATAPDGRLSDVPCEDGRADVFACDGVAEKQLPRVAFFDTYPEEATEPVFAGTWSNYPYFDSGTIAVTGIGEGLFLLRLQDDVRPA